MNIPNDINARRIVDFRETKDKLQVAILEGDWHADLFCQCPKTGEKKKLTRRYARASSESEIPKVELLVAELLKKKWAECQLGGEIPEGWEFVVETHVYECTEPQE